MAYGEKFSLQFSDVYNNPRKLSILKKDYTGEVFPLIGTENPVVLKWHNKDDVYNPIIGSTCEISLFVTESIGGNIWEELDENWNLSEIQWNESTGTSGTNYDNWYEADEREYKVQISTGDISGSPHWDSINDQWQTSAVDWDDPTGQGFEFYWEGFIVVDNYQEAFTSTPYPIKLIASDGLGTLDGFDAPYSNVVLTPGGNIDTTDGSQSNFDGLFYYLIEILKLTNLDFDVFISNYVRGSSVEANKTLFHDIQAFEFGLLKNNFKRLNAKELLFKILEMTNSRVFQSQGRWYVVSNSNLIDERIIESQETTVSTPIVQNMHLSATENVPLSIELYGFDADGLSLTFAIVDDTNNGTTSLSGSTVTYTPSTDFVGFDFFTFTANNGTNTSVAAGAYISVNAAPNQTVTPGALVVPPYNVRPFVKVYFGNTIGKSLAKAKGKTSLYFAKTHESYILDQISSKLDAFRSNVSLYGFNPYNFGISVGAGQANGSDANSWRWGQVGTKMVYYLLPVNLDASPLVDYGYRVSDNTTDPTPPSSLTKFPRTPDFDNAVLSLPDGYYSFYTIPFVNNLSTFVDYKTGYAEALSVDYSTMPQISSRNDYPQDLKDVISYIGQEYIVTVRVENDYIVERYQFASE